MILMFALMVVFGLGMYVIGRLHERITWSEWILWELDNSPTNSDLSWIDRTPMMQNDIQDNFFKSIFLRNGKEYRRDGK